MIKKKDINYLEIFTFSDIYWQPYPVYNVSESGNLFNFKSIINPGKSAKRYTRAKQLKKRSLQAKIFDSFINIGFFNPLIVVKEYPVVIQNSHRLEGQDGGFYLIDYYFPNVLNGKGLFVELDSDYHNPKKDEIRDKYLLETLGVKTFRITGLEKESVQKGKFQELLKLLRSEEAINEVPKVFNYGENIKTYLKERSL